MIVAATGIAAAGAAVWLTVRIVNRREKWARRTAVTAVVVGILYPLSAGPGTWLIHHGGFSKATLRFVLALYEPLGLASDHLPKPVDNAMRSYEEWFVDAGWPSKLRASEMNPPDQASDAASAN